MTETGKHKFVVACRLSENSECYNKDKVFPLINDPLKFVWDPQFMNEGVLQITTEKPEYEGTSVPVMTYF